MSANFAYLRARNLREALEHLGSDGARVHAGGTDLLGCLRDGVFEAETVVSLSRIDALRGIEETPEGGLRIGALTTIAAVAADPLVAKRYRALSQAANAVASPQLRNQGTIGGNLCQKPRCWYYRGEFHCLRKGGDLCYAYQGQNRYHAILGGGPCFIVHPSDTAPALVALEAVLRIEGPKGEREVPVESFHVPPSTDPRRETVLEPGEVVTDVLIPPPAPGLRSSYRKVRARGAWDFALAGAALALALTGKRVTRARVVLSGAAPVPWRARDAEAALTGKTLDEATASAAAEKAVAGADPLDRNGYKVPLFRGMLEEELVKIAGA
jgi:xanthine dehydrogenase YagS FAD-binding subunit